jgi:hypothetical protein
MKSFLILLSIALCASAFDASYYPNKLQLLPEYALFWNLEGDYMRIAVQVKTTGWVGFGIGEPTSGSMPGADILFASVKEGKTTINDMYALAKDTPMMDDCQNWDLISGEEANGMTTVEAKRRLNTNDTQDRPFEAESRVVIAWGNSDTFGYHSANRKPVVVRFWGPKNPSLPSVSTKQYLNLGYTIPTERTTYEEKLFDAGFTSDVSVVAIQPLVNNTPFVHHFLVFGCKLPFANATRKSTWELLWGWAPGIEHLVLPEGLGFTFGPSNYQSIRIQIHYDNPLNKAGEKDNSGIALYFENTLRPIEAGVLELGDPTIADTNGIAAGTGTAEYEYNCPGVCTASFNRTLNVWGNSLHMHQIGAQMWGKQWRDGQLIRETNRIDFWDFGLQQMTVVNYTIQPGDRISTHCIYNRQSQYVPFGEGSDEEMCIQFIYYWPKATKGRGACAFYLDTEKLGPNNLTICDSDPVSDGKGGFLSNPSEVDPPGGTFIAFGKPNPSNFKCAVKVDETSKVGETSKVSETTNKPIVDVTESSAGIMTVFVCLLLTLLFL